MKQQRFKAAIEKGHKGDAVIVPFNPETAWKLEPAQVPRPWRRGWLVEGTLNARAFEGWIGFRWGRFFMIVDEDLQRAAKVSAGDEVQVVVEPRRPSRTPA